MEDEHETSALRHRRRKSSMSISACFHHGSGSGKHSDSWSVSSSPAPSPNFRKSPSSWFRSSKQRCHEVPDMIKPKRRNIMSRLGRHRRHASADFHYDPLSYALNFADEEATVEVDQDNHNFVSRLPVTPPRKRPGNDLVAKMDALELRGHGDREPIQRDTAAGELRNNVFEVRTPRGKVEAGRSSRSPRSPSKEGMRNVEVSSPRVAHEILV